METRFAAGSGLGFSFQPPSYSVSTRTEALEVWSLNARQWKLFMVPYTFYGNNSLTIYYEKVTREA